MHFISQALGPLSTEVNVNNINNERDDIDDVDFKFSVGMHSRSSGVNL